MCNADVTINLAERPGLAFSYGEYDQEMSPSLNMPADKARTLSLLTDDLRVVPNVIAIVLGGSYASGMAGASSDPLPRLGLLVAAINLMSLPSPRFQPAFRTAIALATVA
jgi:hypothetical protein